MADTTKSLTISSTQPNLRFGTSLLDTKYRDYAAPGETLMDKRTGEVILKRKSDGSLIYFDREQVKATDYIAEIKALMNNNPLMTYPTMSNCPMAEKTYFMGSLIDTTDFIPSTDNLEKTYSSGEKFVNNSENPAFTFSHEMNGAFIKLEARPRDVALVDYCSSVYNEMYKNYSGTDSVSLEQKELLKSKVFETSNAQVDFTVKMYNESGSLSLSKTISGYVRLNEMSVLPFFELTSPRNTYSYVTIEINSISIPKLKYVPKTILSEELKKNIFKELADSEESSLIAVEENIAITHAYLSSFIEVGGVMIMPDKLNTKVTNFIPLQAFEDSMNAISKLGYELGISVSEQEPDDETLVGLNVWVEKFRKVYSKGDTQLVDNPVTDFDELEALFGECESINGNFTSDSSLFNDFFVGLTDSMGNYIKPSALSNYSQENLIW